MKTILLSYIFIISCDFIATKKITVFNIGVFLDEENSQINIPLNHAMFKSSRRIYNGIHFNITTEIIPKSDVFKSQQIFCRTLEKIPHPTAFFLSESSLSSAIIQSLTEKLQYPYIQTSWSHINSYLGSKTSLNFHPDYNLMMQGLAAIFDSLQWKTFVILYENVESLIRWQQIFMLHKYENQNFRNHIVIKKIDIENIMPVLKAIKDSGEFHIFLDCEVNHIMTILEQAKSIGITSFIHSYFLTSVDAHILDLEALKIDANITTVRIINPEDEDFKNIIESWKYNEFPYQQISEPYKVKTETMLIHESINLLMEAVDDIHRHENIEFNNVSCKNEKKFNYGSRIISYMNSHFMKPSPLDGLPFDDRGKRTNFTLYLIEGNRDKVIATWNSIYKELNIMRSEEESYKRLIQSLQKGKHIVASKLQPPYLMLKENYENLSGNDRYEGYCKDLITDIANILNFEFKFSIVEDNMNGVYDPHSKNWTGIIGEVINQKALLGIADTTITSNRKAVVDFSMPFMRLGIGILLKRPDNTVSMFAFLNALSVEVWMYTATLYLTVSVILYFVARMAPGDWENPHPCNLNPDELENIWSINNCLWLTMGSIMNQGSDILPKGISSRLVSSMWWFFALIMTNSYTASLAAIWTTGSSVIDDLEDLAKQNKIKYGTLKYGTTEEFFRQSNYSTYRRMYANMMMSKPSVFVTTTMEGIKRVESTKNGLYTFIMESSTIDYLTERNCNLTTINQYFNTKEYGIVMPLDCPYRNAINDAILQLQEKGELNNLKNKWWRNTNPGPPCKNIESGSELKLENVGGIFVVLGIGVTIALLLGILEFFWTVRQTSIDQHLSYWQAFKIEFIFALKVWVSRKKAKIEPTSSNSSLSFHEDDTNNVDVTNELNHQDMGEISN